MSGSPRVLPQVRLSEMPLLDHEDRKPVRLRDRPGRVRDVDLIWEQVVVDAHNPVALGRWWAESLGWVVVGDAADEFEIRPTPDRVPGLLFVPVPEKKAGKNTLHLDFRLVDQTAEVERLLSLGARRADVGQRDASWVVLADPEGNEFCKPHSRRASSGGRVSG